MKTIQKFAVAIVLICSVVAVNAQSKVSTPITRYADTFGLDEDQVTKLEKVYADTDAEMKALGDRMVAHRLKLQTVQSIPSENAQWKTDLQALTDEHKAIQKVRDTEMLKIFNKKQKAAWESWKANEIDWSDIPASLEK